MIQIQGGKMGGNVLESKRFIKRFLKECSLDFVKPSPTFFCMLF